MNGKHLENIKEKSGSDGSIPYFCADAAALGGLPDLRRNRELTRQTPIFSPLRRGTPLPQGLQLSTFTPKIKYGNGIALTFAS
jgi:hypothetical protein